MTIALKNDQDVAQYLGLTDAQLQSVVDYIKTGTARPQLGNCPSCSGWGRFGDDVFCGRCNGTGDIPDAQR